MAIFRLIRQSFYHSPYPKTKALTVPVRYSRNRLSSVSFDVHSANSASINFFSKHFQIFDNCIAMERLRYNALHRKLIICISCAVTVRLRPLFSPQHCNYHAGLCLRQPPPSYRLSGTILNTPFLSPPFFASHQKRIVGNPFHQRPDVRSDTIRDIRHRLANREKNHLS